MTTEFNLSDRVCEDADACYPSHVLLIKDVKEFIRLLKERGNAWESDKGQVILFKDVKEFIRLLKERGNAWESDKGQVILLSVKELDRLAGEKLS